MASSLEISEPSTPKQQLLDLEDQADSQVIYDVTFNGDSPVMEKTKSPTRKRMLIKKEGEDKVSLPKPFPLPQHFSIDVERALKTNKTRRRVRVTFNTMVSSSPVLLSKCYPCQTRWTLMILYILGITLLCHGSSKI